MPRSDWRDCMLNVQNVLQPVSEKQRAGAEPTTDRSERGGSLRERSPWREAAVQVTQPLNLLRNVLLACHLCRMSSALLGTGAPGNEVCMRQEDPQLHRIVRAHARAPLWHQKGKKLVLL